VILRKEAAKRRRSKKDGGETKSPKSENRGNENRKNTGPIKELPALVGEGRGHGREGRDQGQ